MIGTAQLINTFSRPCFTDTTDIFKDGSGVALYGLDYDASDAGGASGKFGEAAIFNGSSSKITLSSTISGIKTYSFWINPNSSGNATYARRLFGDVGGTSYTNSITFDKPNSKVTYYENTTARSSATISDDTWSHIAFTSDGTTLKVYTNGSLSNTYTTSGFVSSINEICSTSSNRQFKGSIDQVRIFNTALTQSQVTQLYQENNSTVGTHLFGCVANYNLDGSAKESMGTTAYDGTETDITYRYDGTPTAVDFGVGGKSNYGARFNGSSSYITSNSLPSIGTGDFTFSCWFNQNSGSSQGALFSTTTQWFAANGNVSPKVLMVTDDTVTKKGDTTYSQDTWNHAVFARESGVLKMYQNGTEVFSGAYTDSWDMTQFGIGVARAFGSRVYYFNGEIDQVRIFSKALSSAEVGKLYGNGAGEIACEYTSTTDNVAYPIANTAYYKLDNNSKDSARSTGKFNEGAIFNGSSSKIVLPTSTFSPSTFSLSAWCNVTSDTDENTILELFDNQTYPNHTTIVLSAGGTGYSSRFLLRNYATNQYNYNPSGTVSKNVWKHYAMTYDGSTVKSYIDGSLVDSGSLTLSNTVGTISSIQIGLSSGSRHLNGSIDQVRVFNTALSSTDVSNLYAETVSDTSTLSFPSGKTAIATYQLDGNSTDLSGNYNGTDTNITYAYDGTESNIEYRFGRYGQAAVFNGSSSRINLPTGDLRLGTNNFSISLWFNSANITQDNQSLFWFQHYQNPIRIGATVSSSSSGGDKDIRFDCNVSGSGVIINTNSDILESNTWYHAVFVKSSTTGMSIYINGVLVASNTSATGAVGTNMTSNGTNSIGVYQTTASSSYFNGKIDQFRMFTTDLSSSQVTQLYNEKPEVDTSNFKTVLYKGNGGTQYISNVGFDLDVDDGGDGGLVWIKARTTGASHSLQDTVNGEGQSKNLYPDNTGYLGQYGVYGFLSTFEANGFFVDAGSGNHTNGNNQDYVAWVWKGGGDAVAGSSSQATNVSYSANQDAGFSIVKFTSSTSTSTPPPMNYISHGLNSPVEMTIYKRLDTTQSWTVQHKDLDQAQAVYLDLSNAAGIPNTTYSFFDNTSQAGNIGVRSNFAISRGAPYIAYCFHSVPEYSKIGSYPGTGANGNSIFTGFEPAFVMVKRTNADDNWAIVDSKRGLNESLFADLSSQELNNSGAISFESNGFTVNGASGGWNNGSSTYIYMAFK